MWHDAGGNLERAREIMKGRAERTTECAAEALRPSALSVETVAPDCDPRSVIVDEAKEWSADLIIVGSHGYTVLKRRLPSSGAQTVVSHAPCSVEVVRRKQADESRED
ncbi:MAG TPA: universal stress protein [Blastocatellia bacterium]|nr:universal stress protein [Blastocatellia bacterium]